MTRSISDRTCSGSAMFSLHSQMPTARERGHGVVGRLLISTELDNQPCPSSREQFHHGATNPPRAARDQHHPAVEAHLHRVPGLVISR
jgi:hypothetical protein